MSRWHIVCSEPDKETMNRFWEGDNAGAMRLNRSGWVGDSLVAEVQEIATPGVVWGRWCSVELGPSGFGRTRQLVNEANRLALSDFHVVDDAGTSRDEVLASFGLELLKRDLDGNPIL